MSVTLPATSLEYVYVPDIRAFRDGAEADATTLPVDVALVATSDQPEESDWVAASWVPAATSPTARVLIGPGGDLTPAAGRWTLWLRVRGAVEQPQRAVGAVRIF